jgi:glycosyltransferase involved in cell wall biosynthesis
VFGPRFSREEEGLMSDLNIRHCFNHQRGNDEDLANAYLTSNALIITSIYEGFGLPILESMLSGCPVVSTRSGALGEIGGGFDIPFESSNPSSLADTLKFVMNSNNELKSLRENGYIHARNFSWDLTAQKTLQLYSELIG